MAHETEERPPFPADGICPKCGSSDDWKDTEEGYTRWSDLSIETGVDDNDNDYQFAHVVTDGWDDMSEDGTDHYATCFGCLAEFKCPDMDMEYD